MINLTACMTVKTEFQSSHTDTFSVIAYTESSISQKNLIANAQSRGDEFCRRRNFAHSKLEQLTVRKEIKLISGYRDLWSVFQGVKDDHERPVYTIADRGGVAQELGPSYGRTRELNYRFIDVLRAQLSCINVSPN
jgi:hypothetical protein